MTIYTSGRRYFDRCVFIFLFFTVLQKRTKDFFIKINVKRISVLSSVAHSGYSVLMVTKLSVIWSYFLSL